MIVISGDIRLAAYLILFLAGILLGFFPLIIAIILLFFLDLARPIKLK